MTDESLRDLEREVREKPDDLGARLKLARALERVGRKDDALAALTPAVADAEVRREIGRLAPPVRESAGLYFDVPGIVREPVVKWEARGNPATGRAGTDALIATPLALISQSDRAVTAFDAASGQRRWGMDRIQFPIVTRDVVCERGLRDFSGRDIFTGELLWTVDAQGPHHGRLRVPLADDGLLIEATSQPALVARVFDDPRRPPGERLFEIPGEFDRVTAAAGAVIVQAHRGTDFLVLDARTGAERFRGQGFFWMSDERGLVADREDGSLASYTPAGRLEWTTSGTAYRPWALAPSFIAASSIAQDDAGRDEIRHVALDRLTGAATELARGGPQDTVAVARDVIYIITTSTVSAYRPTGERLWRLDLSSRWPRSGGWQLHSVPAPLARRLYLLVPPNGWVLCLEEPAAKLLS
jgi:hypothetical protein